MIDEVSVYLRKVERAYPGASGQFTAFLHALFKAVETAPNVALVFTLAVGKDSEAKDAYREEHERALASLAEAEMVASRKATQLNPTEEDETADVLRRRLFDEVDRSAADAVVAAYADVWNRNQVDLPASVLRPEIRDLFRRGYPLHPETLSVLTEKLSSLSTFQRTRGMLRLLARTVHVLWRDKPADALAIHPHHIDPSFGPIRNEITTRLGQGEYTPALKADVAAVEKDEKSTAQELDLKYFPGQLPIHSYVARTIFLHTLAFGDAAKGIASDHLKLSVCSPTVEPSFVEQARTRFVTESLFLDDRPGALLRFMVEPNLTQVIRRQMEEVEANELRAELNERIRNLFGAAGGSFNLQAFPAGAYEVDDTVGDGRPNLVLLHHDAFAINADPQGLPPLIEEIFKYKGTDQRLREFRNNLVFVVADERQVKNMKDRVRRRLALAKLKGTDRINQLAAHQQEKVKEEYQKSSLQCAEAILHCYRHLFFPYNVPMAGSAEPIAHAAIEVPNASDTPGNGQLHVARVLREHHKLLSDGDSPEAPSFVRDQTPLKQKGELSTLELRNEYRRAPKLSMLVSNGPLIACIRQGIDSEVFIYREGNQVWGKGDPAPVDPGHRRCLRPHHGRRPQEAPLAQGGAPGPQLHGLPGSDRTGPEVRPDRGRLGGCRSLHLQRERSRPEPRKQEPDHPEVRGLPRSERNLPGRGQGQPGPEGDGDDPCDCHRDRQARREALGQPADGDAGQVDEDQPEHSRRERTVHDHKPCRMAQSRHQLGHLLRHPRSAYRDHDLLRRCQRRLGCKSLFIGRGHGGDPDKASAFLARPAGAWPSPNSGRRLGKPRSPPSRSSSSASSTRRPPGRSTRRWPRSRKPRSTAASRPTSSRKASTPSSSSSTVGWTRPTPSSRSWTPSSARRPTTTSRGPTP